MTPSSSPAAITLTLPEALQQAIEFHKHGALPQAEQLYQAILSAAPDQADANHNLGILYFHVGQGERALPFLQAACVARPEVGLFRLSLLRALLVQGRVQEVLAQFAAGGGGAEPEWQILRARAEALLPLVGEDGRAFAPKVFCIGRNKTGTTSIEAVLSSFGYRLGNQAAGEMLLEDWARGDFSRIIELAATADAFQDIPFSLPGTYQALDRAFPGSKFILSVRSSPERWLQSVTRFHTKIVGKNRLPTKEDLQEFSYREKGWLWRNQQLVYQVDADSLYDPDIYMQHYRQHNQDVMDYFAGRPQDLLVVNLEEAAVMPKLCAFLGFADVGLAMPHLNRSD